MKQATDHYTRDLFSNKLDRPRMFSAKTGVQRQHKVQPIAVTSGSEESCLWFCGERLSCCGVCNIGQLGRKEKS